MAAVLCQRATVQQRIPGPQQRVLFSDQRHSGRAFMQRPSAPHVAERSGARHTEFLQT